MAAAGAINGSRMLVPAAAAIMCLMILAAAPGAAGITCGQVASSLAPCINYIRAGGVVPPGCCAGVRNLNAAANTPQARQFVCGCLKSFGRSITGLNPGLAAGVPGKCGVSVGYAISFNTDCSKVH